MPLTAKIKGSSQLRYEFPVATDMKAHVQGLVTYEGRRTRDLRLVESALYGTLPGFAQVDLAAGVERGSWDAELYVKNAFDGRGQTSKIFQCLEFRCGDVNGNTERGKILYTTHIRPRTIGLRAGYKF